MAGEGGERGARWLLTALGLGRAPVLPGTAASLGTAVAIVAVQHLTGHGMAMAGALFAYGVAVTLVVGRRFLGPGEAADPRWVVSDEVAGQALASAAALATNGVVSAAAAFVLFRAFDVLKPFPIRRLERIGGPLGVLADDLAAGAAAGAVVLLLAACGAFAALA